MVRFELRLLGSSSGFLLLISELYKTYITTAAEANINARPVCFVPGCSGTKKCLSLTIGYRTYL